MKMGKCFAALLAMVGLAIPVAAQFGAAMPQWAGVWHPVVGSGAAYQMTGREGQKEMEIAVVGQEKFEGQDGYWLEMSFQDPRGGPGAMKTLMVMGGPNPGAKKVILMMRGQAYEMSLNNPMMAGRAPKPGVDVSKGGATLVGTESITVPAGTFECQHYRTTDSSPADVWVSAKISPWGLVKSQSKDNTMVLTKVITDAKTKITGPVLPFESLMQQGGRP